MQKSEWVCLVTGSTRGIGYASAKLLVEQGARVAFNGRTVEAVEQAIAKLGLPSDRACAAAGDISDRNQIEHIFTTVEERWGAVNILVNNSAWWEIRPTLEITPEIWQNMIDVNLSGLFYCGQRALRQMVSMRRGAIINISSIAAKTGGKHPVAHYAAAKAGVLSLTRSCATEFAPFGIRVNAIAPGIIDTEMAGSIIAEFAPQVPLKRVGRPEEVAEAVYLLAQQIDGFITGEIIDVNGGLLID